MFRCHIVTTFTAFRVANIGLSSSSKKRSSSVVSPPSSECRASPRRSPRRPQGTRLSRALGPLSTSARSSSRHMVFNGLTNAFEVHWQQYGTCRVPDHHALWQQLAIEGRAGAKLRPDMTIGRHSILYWATHRSSARLVRKYPGTCQIPFMVAKDSVDQGI